MRRRQPNRRLGRHGNRRLKALLKVLAAYEARWRWPANLGTPFLTLEQLGLTPRDPA